MNCCDSFGNCNQGRDCPVRRKARKPTPKPIAAWRINLKGKHITWVFKRTGFIRIGRLMLRWGEESGK